MIDLNYFIGVNLNDLLGVNIWPILELARQDSYGILFLYLVIVILFIFIIVDWWGNR
jgi:hypothetical protein